MSLLPLVRLGAGPLRRQALIPVVGFFKVAQRVRVGRGRLVWQRSDAGMRLGRLAQFVRNLVSGCRR